MTAFALAAFSAVLGVVLRQQWALPAVRPWPMTSKLGETCGPGVLCLRPCCKSHSSAFLFGFPTLGIMKALTRGFAS